MTPATEPQQAPWTDLLAADALAADEVITVQAQHGEIALYSVAGQVFATDNRCSHGNARLSEGFLLDHEIECPLHQGRFDVRTGAATCGPARQPLRCYPAKLEAGRIWLQLGVAAAA